MTALLRRVVLVALLLACASPAAAETLPALAFARLPAIETAVISPDGLRLAYVGGAPEDRVIFITPIDAGPPVTIRPGLVNVKGLRWAGSRHLLLQIAVFNNDSDFGSGLKTGYTYRRDLIIEAAQGNVLGQLLSGANLSRLAIGLPVRSVIDADNPVAIVEGLDLSQDATQASRLSILPRKGDHIVPALWRVDIVTGKFRMVERGNRQTWGYETDLTGEARLRWDYDDISRTLNLMGRRKGSGGWSLLDRSPIDQPRFKVLGYADPDDALIFCQETDKGSRIMRRGLADGTLTELGPATPAPHAGVLWDEHRAVPVAIVTQDDRPLYQWLDPDLAAVHARLSRAFAGQHVALANWSRDRRRFVVRTDAPTHPPAWFLYDVRSRQVSAIGQEYPELTGASLSETRWISYSARDGLRIPAYLTLPPVRTDGSRPPLVVLPHGGPAARDDFGFDWMVQFLASRGYAVLQPQFRGSSGFGDAFERAGYGEWGGKMQSDLEDGVKAMAAQGQTTDQACILGFGYGGYAALAGAAFRPETYRCAVSINGASDLGLSIGSTRRAYGEDSGALAYWRTSIGDPRIDGEALAAASPGRRLAGRASPILLMHAELDTVVPLEQAQVMQRALKSAGQPGELILLEGDDHGLSKTRSRLRVLEATETFLATHLPVAR